jgi:phage-related protein
MDGKYRVLKYVDKEGIDHVTEFLDSLPVKDRAIMISAIQRKEQNGPMLQQTNMDKNIAYPIRELVKEDNRILYAIIDKERYLLLCGFEKYCKKTPEEQKSIARSLLSDYKKGLGKIK